MNTSKKEIANYNLAPTNYHHTNSRDIADFTASRVDENIDLEVVKSFGEEWNKFHHFSKNPSKKYVLSILILLMKLLLIKIPT